ncbi:hypothetical protein ANN_08027 [Periplaneta americana]|uniref:Uncharacterized protein n=1 Tax=Periplaneta americana TaxID=6978 RepID=A0ABQ8T0Y5_PERAM|nr:hypothetical protein ANN_08027 [Periplaneta americana]
MRAGSSPRGGKEFSHEISASVWDRYPSSIVMHLGNYDNVLFKYMENVSEEVHAVFEIQLTLSIDVCNAVYSRIKNLVPPGLQGIQNIPEKRKVNANALEADEHQKMIYLCDERTPTGLEIKFFLIASVELASRGREDVKCHTYHFEEEVLNDGKPTGRIA